MMAWNGLLKITELGANMNTRIKQLAEQAGFEFNSLGGIYTTGTLSDNLEKFAQLIVQECANHCDLLLDYKISSEWSRGTHDCSRAIKQHFGVEQ
jgi:hypothetical protein